MLARHGHVLMVGCIGAPLDLHFAQAVEVPIHHDHEIDNDLDQGTSFRANAHDHAWMTIRGRYIGVVNEP